MRLHVIVNVTPDGEQSSARSDAVLEALEAEAERMLIEIDGVCYDTTVLGSGKTARDALESARMRRQR